MFAIRLGKRYMAPHPKCVVRGETIESGFSHVVLRLEPYYWPTREHAERQAKAWKQTSYTIESQHDDTTA